MELVNQGKSKSFFATDNPNTLVMEFREEGNEDKGAGGKLAKRMTSMIFQHLERNAIATHFLEDMPGEKILVRRSEMIDIEVYVRNDVAGLLEKRSGLAEGTRLRQPLVELYYKSSDMEDALITDEHVRELNLALPDDLAKMKRMGLRANAVLLKYFAAAGIRLADFRLEFGKLHPDKKNVILADAITPDTCRLTDEDSGALISEKKLREMIMSGVSEPVGSAVAS